MKRKMDPVRRRVVRRKFYLRSILWLPSMPQASKVVCLRELTQLRQSMLCGGSTASSCNTTTLWSGCGPRSDPPLAINPKDPMPGWTESNQHPALDWTNCSPTSSTTMLTNSCSGTSCTPSSPSSKRTWSLQPREKSLRVGSPFSSNSSRTRTSWRRPSYLCCSNFHKEAVSSPTQSPGSHSFSQEAPGA